MAANKERLYNAQCFGALGIFSSFFPFLFLPSLMLLSLLSLFGKAAFWLHTKTRLRLFWAEFVEAVLFFLFWVLLLIMP